MAVKDSIVSLLLNFRVHVLLKITVIHKLLNKYYKMVLWFNFTFFDAMVSLVSPKHFHWTWLWILLLNKSLNSNMWLAHILHAVTIVLSSSWVSQSSQEKMDNQNAHSFAKFWKVNKIYYGQFENDEWWCNFIMFP